jgi:hypothetical protein
MIEYRSCEYRTLVPMRDFPSYYVGQDGVIKQLRIETDSKNITFIEEYVPEQFVDTSGFMMVV